MVSRLIKFSVSLFVWIIDYIRDGIRKLIGGKPAGTCVVLYYHAISPEQRSSFAWQMDDLLKWTKPISADINIPLEKGVRHAAITFDDGFISVLDNALPVLNKRRIPSTLFVQTGYLGQRPKWIKDEESHLYNEMVLTASQLRGLKNELVTIGSHCVTHTNLLLLKEEEIKHELSDSKRELEKLLGHSISLLSFPHGGFNQQIVKWSKEAGYKRVFTILPTLGLTSPDEFVTGRISVEPIDWHYEFRLKLLGAYRWLPFAFSIKKKVRKMCARKDKGSAFDL